jgi:uncharacterized membrane protein (TIGR02234 family)
MKGTAHAFAPTLILGFAGSALVAVAGSKPWVDLPTGSGAPRMGAEEMLKEPLAGALGLLLLATWGVILVTGPLARRVAAGIGLLASLGVVATVVDGYHLVERVTSTLETGNATRNAWLWAALLGAVLALSGAALALRFAPTWPRMSSRYDSPASRAEEVTQKVGEASGEPLENSERELWDEINQGHDPTTRPPTESDPLD